MAITEFLSLEKPAKEDRISIDVLNDNTDEIDKQFKRNSIVLSTTGKNISVSATGPYYTVTNNNAATVQALLEGNSMLLDPGETFKMNKAATETFTLVVTCASDVTVTYFQRNKDYVDGSLASNLENYYDKTGSDSIFLKTEDFGNMRKEKSDSICTVDLPLKYNAAGNPVEEYRIHGDTSQPATPTLASAVIPIGTGDLVTDSESEHYNEYALPIINNSIAYNVYLATPLYRVNDKSDYIDYARQKVIRNVGIITYDGSTDEAWENYEYKNYRIDLTNLGGGDNPRVPYEVLCDKLLKTSEDNLGIVPERIAICGGYVHVHFNSTMTDVTTFKTYLASNPITVYYPLASEVTEDVTLPDILTISGENQLYVNTTVTPKNVVVGALMQYLTRKDMNDTFPGLDNVYTKLEVNSMVNSLNAEVVTKAESVNDINQINGNISLTLDDVPDGDGRKMAGLATETYVNSAIGNVNSFNVLVVQSLPTVDIQQHTIYFVPKVQSDSGDVYDEYMYINSTWEHIGTSEADLSNYYTKSEVNTAISNKADSTVLTTHTENADIHVTAADKTAWNMMPKSKTIDQILGVNVYKDFVVPLTEVTAGVENTYFYGQIFLKRTNGANDEITIINAMCCNRRYNVEEATYNINTSNVFTPIKPCVFSYNSKKYFGLHVNITSSEYEIFRVDARTTTNYNDIKMIFIYDTNANQVINSEIYNSLNFTTTGINVNTNFFAIPRFVDSNYVKRKLLYFSSAPATLTSSGTVGDIAYDTSYMYICTATNIWKKLPLGTAHEDNTDIHVTSADKTAWNLIPKSKSESDAADTHSYQDFVIPILNIASTYTHEFFYGQIYLKRTNGAGQQMTIINLMCGKSYNEEKAVYYMDKSQMWTATKPCSFVYNGKKMFGIHVKITASDYNILRVDARTTTDFGIITPVYIYNNNTSAVLNAEIYNSLSFFDGYNMPMNFYEIPKVIKTDGTATKLLSFSSVPATLTSSGTVGDIAYDTSYMYICTATNIWKKILLGTAHEDNTDIHVTSADKTAWNLIPRSKSIDQILGINVYKDFVVPLTEVTAGTENTYFYGQIFLKRTNGANDEITIINAMCGKRYNQEKAVYDIDASDVFTPIKPCVFSYNSKKYFGLHVNIATSEYEIFRVDARTTTNYNDIKMIFIYDTNAKQVINSEIYNSLDFATPGTSVNTNFYAIPQFVDSNYVKRKLLYFSSAPATLTSSGTVGDIAYDTSYMYICTATNTWKKILLGTAHEGNTDIHVTSADKTAWNGKVSYTAVPASATATGTKGDIAYDSEYMYVCTDTNTWKRTALTTW